MANEATPFPDFGNSLVVTRPPDFDLEVGIDADVNQDYVYHAYQFASSTRPDMCQPAKIIYAESDDDIMKAVKYAYSAKISLAVRSSGHQYQGYSSTTGVNVQVDVSKMKTIKQQAPGSTQWTVQAGCKLQDFDAAIRAQGMFIPHGECTTVAVGGHIQTGGFAPSFSRSFGLFVDHVTEFTIIMAPEGDGQDPVKKVVTKPKEGATNELWYTILGGSPGNFGIITQVKFNARKDDDHKHSRGIWFPFIYRAPNEGRKVFEKLMSISCEYSDKDDLPADYCFNVFMLHGNPFESQDLKEHKNIDVMMCKKHPEKYGPRAPSGPAWVGLSLVWCNLKGDKCKFNETDESGYNAESLFDEVTKRVRGLRGGKDFDFVEELKAWWKGMDMDPGQFCEFLNGYTNMGLLQLRGKKDRMISDIMYKLSFPYRVLAAPCLGATQLGFDNNLSKNNHSFSKWIADIADQGMWTKGVLPACQLTLFGNKNSQMRTENCGNHNVLGFRDTTVCFFDYYHYYNTYENEDVETPKDMAVRHTNQVVEGLAGPDGKSGFFGCDSRWMAFCNQDENLDELWEKYFNNRSDYLRVMKMKRTVDPTDVFTPNLFCVGATKKYGIAPAGSAALMTIQQLQEEINKCGDKHGQGVEVVMGNFDNEIPLTDITKPLPDFKAEYDPVTTNAFVTAVFETTDDLETGLIEVDAAVERSFISDAVAEASGEYWNGVHGGHRKLKLIPLVAIVIANAIGMLIGFVLGGIISAILLGILASVMAALQLGFPPIIC